MNLFFFDCETIGLPKDYKASYEDVDNWPRVMSLAWSVTDHTGNTIGERYHMIQPDGWVVPKEKFWIDNDYSTERSMKEGIPIENVIAPFMEDIQDTEILVAHNLNFDHRIVWAEIIRSGRAPKSGMQKICTMMSSTKHCRLPQTNGRGGNKWPKLEELHQVLFGCDFEGAHNAMADVQSMKKCFFELLRLGIIQLPVAA